MSGCHLCKWTGWVFVEERHSGINYEAAADCVCTPRDELQKIAGHAGAEQGTKGFIENVGSKGSLSSEGRFTSSPEEALPRILRSFEQAYPELTIPEIEQKVKKIFPVSYGAAEAKIAQMESEEEYF